EYEGQFSGKEPSKVEIRERVARDFLDKGVCAYFVAECDGKIIGAIKIAKKESGSGKISEAYVLDDYRGKGVMTALFNEAVKWAELHGIHNIYLTVVNGNSLAFAFWKKRGFCFESYVGDLLIKMSCGLGKELAG
ncbi:MAG: GNAT family N-acetyltransferase, partial [Candidatus Micrarchaeota archaeon]|nr:GNAT family N-acetyltransferase [Candidatus Micrarchaeota archaeon]